MFLMITITIFYRGDFTFQDISHSLQTQKKSGGKLLYILSVRSSSWEIFLNHSGNLSHFDGAGQGAAQAFHFLLQTDNYKQWFVLSFAPLRFSCIELLWSGYVWLCRPGSSSCIDSSCSGRLHTIFSVIQCSPAISCSPLLAAQTP